MGLTTSCLKDLSNEPEIPPLQTSSKILTYLESNGDYINSGAAPAVISTAEVYTNLGSYLLIDVRTDNEYSSGHIQNAVRVNPSELLNYITANKNLYPKIVIISQCGQSSSFYTGLMRLAGFSNVYTMEYGMAYWNKEFSGVWEGQLKQRNVTLWDFNDHPKPPMSSLPDVQMSNDSTDMHKFILERINNILAKGFSEDTSFANQTIGTTLTAMLHNDLTYEHYFIICYGTPNYYYSKSGRIPGHLPNAVSYVVQSGVSELRSDKFLQTLPKDGNIVIYDYNGITGAQIAAYLNLLGYNAKSLLFGGNTLFYYSMERDTVFFNKYIFDTSQIHNYPFIQ